MTVKTLIDIGGNVWVDAAAIVVVQPRTADGDPLKKIPGCAVFVTGDNEPVYGEDSVNDVIDTIRRAGQ